MGATNTTVAAGERAAHAVTLTADTVDTVTFTGYVPQVEIVSDGTDALYVRVDGTAPTVGGAFSYVLPAGSSSVREIPVPDSKGNNAVIKLISHGTTKYSVTRLP